MNIATLRLLKGNEWKIFQKTVPGIGRNFHIFFAERISGIKVSARTIDELYDLLNGSKHTKECWALINKQWKRMDDWVKAHPNYCRHCGGVGAFFSIYDPSPSGVSLSPGSMTDVDPCPECAEKGICAECGQQMFNPEDPNHDWEPATCPHCGFEEEKATGMPQWDGPCICEEQRIQEEYIKNKEEVYNG